MEKLLFVLTLLFSSCYTFTGIAISPEAKTFYVQPFTAQTADAPPNLSEIFTQKLSDRLRNDTPLKQSETDADITFKGVITSYRVTSEAPQAGGQTTVNRLTIAVKITLEDKTSEEEPKTFTASWFEDFPGDTNLLDVQDQLIEDITDQLVENIFNKAFTNW